MTDWSAEERHDHLLLEVEQAGRGRRIDDELPDELPASSGEVIHCQAVYGLRRTCPGLDDCADCAVWHYRGV